MNFILYSLCARYGVQLKDYFLSLSLSVACVHPSTGSKSSLFEVIQKREEVLYDLTTRSIGTIEM